MKKAVFLFILVLIPLSFSLPLALSGQEIKDAEAEYARIRSMAFDGKLDSAALAGRKLVNSYPSYGDARILLSRILAWQKKYTLAAAVIDTLLATEPQNPDALSLKRDIVQWSKDNRAETTGLRAGYLFDTFHEPYKRFWQVFNAGLEHRYKWGLLAGGVNLGNVNIRDSATVHATEWQLTAEAYPKFSDKNYAYLAYAYSPGMYFPTHRAAAEFWQVLPAGWAVSAGMNYYYFNRNIYIGLASVEKYMGRYWMSLKGYFYFKDQGVTTSEYFTIRRYFTDINYFQLTLGTGTAPDEPFDIRTDLMRYSAYSVRAAYNVALAKRLVMRIGTGFSYEEYQNNIWRNRFEGNIDFVYAIKMK
jgi:YaiO family outer membrane protein